MADLFDHLATSLFSPAAAPGRLSTAGMIQPVIAPLFMNDARAAGFNDTTWATEADSLAQQNWRARELFEREPGFANGRSTHGPEPEENSIVPISASLQHGASQPVLTAGLLTDGEQLEQRGRYPGQSEPSMAFSPFKPAGPGSAADEIEIKANAVSIGKPGSQNRSHEPELDAPGSSREDINSQPPKWRERSAANRNEPSDTNTPSTNLLPPAASAEHPLTEIDFNRPPPVLITSDSHPRSQAQYDLESYHPDHAHPITSRTDAMPTYLAPPIIKITIGRIEIKARPAPAPAGPPPGGTPPGRSAPLMAGPTLSLDAYLKQRSEGKR